MPAGGGQGASSSPLKRKTLEAPYDNGTFIKPIKQSFIRNPRLSPGCKIMLALLAGWAGQQTTIKTTMASIGKQISRSRRQVFRYLQDAVEEGLVLYSKTQNRMGYITGIKIWLNFGAIRHTYDRYLSRKRAEYRKNQDVTHKANINPNSIFNIQTDEEMTSVLARFAQKTGLDYPFVEDG